eukprot:Nk52_evm44s221 gene=Nk52_evmTU44s221
MYASMDKKEIDRQYSPSVWSHRMSPDKVVESHVSTTEEGTTRAERSLKRTRYKIASASCHQEFEVEVYRQSSPGDGEEKWDDKHVVLYYHGGYWQCMGLPHAGFMANSLCSEGVTVVSVGYNLVPDVTMTGMMNECRASLAWAYKHFSSANLFACGHSAGGHISAMLMMTGYEEWERAFMIPRSLTAERPLLAGIIPVSGVFDLRPLRISKENDVLHMTMEEAESLSPKLILERLDSENALDTVPLCNMLVAYGEHDSPEFKRQSDEFVKHMTMVLKNEKAIETSHVEDEDHFSVIEKCALPEFSLSKCIVSFIKKVVSP